MTRLVQIRKGEIRRLALVDEPHLRLLDKFSSLHELASTAVTLQKKVSPLALEAATGMALDYDPVYHGGSEWSLLPPIDHPQDPARCLVSGTGLTHLGSASNRQAMHADELAQLTDSMKMFQWGLAGGRPEPGKIGTPPEWFYKGNGTILRAHGEALDTPSFAEDGGEEAEIAGIYLIDPAGTPLRIGMACGNEFSDHQFEKKNYLNLAGSKLRTSALGPEIVLDPEFQSVPVRVSIERNGALLWSRTFSTGETAMCHNLQNIEHHHFKFELHRRPGDVHVHFFGTAYLSFSDKIQLQENDTMEVHAQGFGRALRNPVHIAAAPPRLVVVNPLG